MNKIYNFFTIIFVLCIITGCNSNKGLLTKKIDAKDIDEIQIVTAMGNPEYGAESKIITDKIDSGNMLAKPGWVRLSLHPTMTNKELDYILKAIKDIQSNINSWSLEYSPDINTGEFYHKSDSKKTFEHFRSWFYLN